MATPVVTGISKQLTTTTYSNVRSDRLPTFAVDTPEFDVNSQEFRFTAILEDNTRVDIGPLVETVEWVDAGNAFSLNEVVPLTGTLTYRKAETGIAGLARTILKTGNRIRCEVLWHGKWSPLWEMRIFNPPEIDVIEDTATANLQDDIMLASRSETIARYRKGKHTRTRGWRYQEVVYDICRRFRIPVNSLVEGKSWITNLDFSGNNVGPPMDVIRQAVEHEVTFTGRKLQIGWRPNAAGRYGITVFHPHRNPILYTLGPQIIGGTVANTYQSGEDGSGQFCTAVVVTASTKKGKNGKRVTYKHRQVAPAQVIHQFGYIEKRVGMPGNVDGMGDVIAYSKSYLARHLVQKKMVTNLQHPGIAFVRKGDAVRISIPEEGFTGKIGLMFVTSVTHTLQAGSYTMALDVTNIDPLDPQQIQKDVEAAYRRRKATQKGTKK